MKFDVKVSVTEAGKKRPEYDLGKDLGGEITLKDLLEYTKATLLVTADAVLREEQAKGFDKEPVMLVDGKKNKDPRNVSPFGEIEFVSRQSIDDILIETYEALFFRSKVLTGTYIHSHYVAWNQNQVATSLTSLKAWLATSPPLKDGDQIRFVNVQPYARRLELLGVTAQRQQAKKEDAGRRRKQKTGTLIRIPNGTYQLTFRSIKAKYKNNINIRFTFMPGSSLGLAGAFKSGRKKSIGRPYLFPVIVFTIDSRGLK